MSISRTFIPTIRGPAKCTTSCRPVALRDRRDAGGLSDHGLATARGRLLARLSRLIDKPPPLDEAYLRRGDPDPAVAGLVDAHIRMVEFFDQHRSSSVVVVA